MMNRVIIILLLLSLSSTAFYAQAPVMRLDTSSIQVLEDSISLNINARIENPGNDTIEVLSVLANGSTATNSVDFQVSGLGLLQWLPNDSTPISISIEVFGDDLFEPSETARIRFLPISTGFQIADTSFELSILNDDSLEVSFSGAGLGLAENEGSARFSVLLNGVPPQAIPLEVAVIGGNADSGVDYLFSDTSLSFPQGDSSRIPLSIEIIDDALSENTEQLIIQLRHSLPSVKYGIRTFTLTIVDNEPVSIQGLAKEGLVLYPNPASDHACIKGERLPDSISLIDVQGKEIDVLIEDKCLYWSDLSPGTYYLLLSERNQVSLGKLMVK